MKILIPITYLCGWKEIITIAACHPVWNRKPTTWLPLITVTVINIISDHAIFIQTQNFTNYTFLILIPFWNIKNKIQWILTSKYSMYKKLLWILGINSIIPRTFNIFFNFDKNKKKNDSLFIQFTFIFFIHLN